MATRMPPRQAPSMELFEAYFQRADLDRDGRISGAEAVAFFQGSNLAKNVLAQIWAYSDRTNAGFLGREEFYNALRLVTVAQSGRGLTKEIVKAALEGPAAAKIPPPQIRSVVTSNFPGNAVPASRPQLNSITPSPVAGTVPPPSAHNAAFHGTQGQVHPNAPTTQRGFPSSQMTGTLQAVPSVPVQPSSQGLLGGSSLLGPGNQNTNVANSSTDLFSAKPSGHQTGGTSQVVSKAVTTTTKQDALGFAPLSTALVPVPMTSQSMDAATLSSSSQHANKDAQALVPTGNGFSSDSIFGGDMFAASQPQGKLSMSSSSAAFQPSTVAFRPAASPGAPTGLAVGAQQSQTLYKQDHPNSLAHNSMPASVGMGISSSATTQSPWRKMTQSDIQRYTKIFVEVDKDRDGKITGEGARKLFLSWGLPREILKQVWELSDQDGDSMLSMREFCIALYLMERFREGSPLPAVLPNNIKFDDVLLQATSHPVTNYGNQTWQPTPGFPQQGMPQTRPVLPATVVKSSPQVQVPSQFVADMHPVKQKPSVPVLEKYLVDQLSNEEQTALNAKLKEATDADTKVKELEKEIMEYKEKNDFYRTKMQELVLYKSRCDTRLNEVIGRASADKQELELLSKKYEDKCKQRGDVASKLTIEEASFRDIQERKLEIYKAIAKLNESKLNEDGNADSSIQSVAEKVQSDLEELVKTLNEQCKVYGLRTKPTTLVELPFGWQPGIQEGSADWDESWDKFDEEGFSLVKDLTIEVENIIAKPKSKLPNASGDTKTSKNELSAAAAAVITEKAEKPSSQDGFENESVFSQSEDAKSPKQSSPRKEPLESLSPKFDARSPKQSSPVKAAFKSSSPKFDAQKEEEFLRSPSQSSPGTGISGNPSQTFSTTRFALNDNSPRVNDQHRDQENADSNRIADNHNDTALWGSSFDAQDDKESIWGFDPVDQGAGNDRGYDSFFGSGDFGLNPIKTETPSAASQYKPSSVFGDSVPATPQYKPSSVFGDSVPATPQYKPSSVFADSVPATPQYSSGFSPKYNDGMESFDSFGPFGRFDSFSNPATLARFDSMRSSTSEVGGFFSQNDSQLARFDSIRSTRDSEAGHGFPSFDDADPFGSGPFKSSGTETPKQTYDNWRAF